uniref:Uncharacterized protein n=1 Tax=Knipowitschia caucasica TaxID=637954 RepID=A0AAV2KY87_KNICA
MNSRVSDITWSARSFDADSSSEPDEPREGARSLGRAEVLPQTLLSPRAAIGRGSLKVTVTLTGWSHRRGCISIPPSPPFAR